MPEVRPPARAGQFYPASESSLKDKIEECFTSSLGPGEIPSLGSGSPRIRGAVVPHAGYEYSGPVAAHVYGAIAEEGYPDTFVIIGPKHPDPFSAGGVPDAAVTKETFSMPFGDVRVNQDIVDEITGGPIEVSSDAHASEHSIEVQIPFLQYFDTDFDFVPILISNQSLEVAKKLGEALRGATEGRDMIIIASTDFTHCGPNYGQLPPDGMTAGEYAKEQDQKAVDEIIELNASGLSRVVDENDISMCGPAGVEATIFAIEENVEGGSLLKYATSQDVVSGRNAVGYGGIIFK